jgi:hypothetical protein
MGRTFFAMARSSARSAAISGPLALGLGVFGAAAQDHDHSHMHTAAPDARQLLDFPPPMREHMLTNMRSHLEALQAVLAALAANDPAKAGAIADTRLGLGSPGAASCNPKAAKGADMMASMMGEHMPEQMRAYGFAMHEAASNFAAQAAKLAPGGDHKPALAALADVTERCAACHAAYRLR